MSAPSRLSSQASTFIALLGEVSYTVTPFEKDALTCEEVEKITGLSQSCLGKSMVVSVDKKPVIAVLSGDKRLNLSQIKECFSARKVYLLPPVNVEEATGLKVGSVTPLLHLNRRDIPIVMDESLLKHSMINISSGDPQFGITIAPADLVELLSPRIANISSL